jgi:hypothetical protein
MAFFGQSVWPNKRKEPPPMKILSSFRLKSFMKDIRIRNVLIQISKAIYVKAEQFFIHFLLSAIEE